VREISLVHADKPGTVDADPDFGAIKMKTATSIVWLAACCVFAFGRAADAADDPADGLSGRWLIHLDARDHSNRGRHAEVRGALDLTSAGPSGKQNTAANFDGRGSYLEVPAGSAPRLGTTDFSVAAWVHTDPSLDDVTGDIVSQYDSARRRGFHLSLKTNAGVTTNQANYRHLQFGIDNDRTTDWTDCGRPGKALLAFGLVVHDGQLYAGTCEPGAGESGRVYRYGGTTEWTDCGSPTESNSVTAMASFDGKLYVGTGKYRLAGSALEESTNTHLGGRMLSYAGEGKWTDCGQLPGVEAVGGLVVFRGKLYASSLYRPSGFFRYEGGAHWTACATPEKRVEAMGVFDGYLWATSYDGGHVFRFDGTEWTDCGQLGSSEENTQTYSFAVYQGRLHVGTWRTGRVYRFEDLNRWADVGRLGEELEVMGMLVHNGRLIAGTLPLAEVYAYEGKSTWRRMTQLDTTPDVRYRRAWTMAESGGRVFVSTLPSGHVHSLAAGATASWDHSFPGGWHPVAAMRQGGRLRLYVDGRQVAESVAFEPGDYDLSSDAPLRIGMGSNDSWRGRLHDVRIYDRALTPAEVERLAVRAGG
jgi:hypothetical protein